MPATRGLAIFPGSFNPPSRIHVDLVRRVGELPGIDAVWLDMTTHVDKKGYIVSVIEHRLRMTEIAVSGMADVGVAQLMSEMGDAGQSVAYFDALSRLSGGASLTWVMGSDVAVSMRWWGEKARALFSRCAQLVVVQRGHADAEVLETLESVMRQSREELAAGGFRITLLPADPALEEVSSSAIRRYLVVLFQHVPLEVLRYVVGRRDLCDFYCRLYEDAAVRSMIKGAKPALGRAKSMKATPPATVVCE